ncbi:hypothetical protein EVAR_93552_1 [Eumeta japonica]|uniref:Uncharacterized protein n=1 Tax=Eumeta variegata TaxID=151549 RepID=A0A4C1USA6_EUMVA|nr:hypothetical protein EVAR_93552_1 [Eumeta japonica]
MTVSASSPSTAGYSPSPLDFYYETRVLGRSRPLVAHVTEPVEKNNTMRRKWSHLDSKMISATSICLLITLYRARIPDSDFRNASHSDSGYALGCNFSLTLDFDLSPVLDFRTSASVNLTKLYSYRVYSIAQ